MQYTATVALNHERIGKKLPRISKIKTFIIKYNWKGIKYSSGKDNQKSFDKNNRAACEKMSICTCMDMC